MALPAVKWGQTINRYRKSDAEIKEQPLLRIQTGRRRWHLFDTQMSECIKEINAKSKHQKNMEKDKRIIL